MRKPWSWWLPSLLLLFHAPCFGATVLKKHVLHTIQDDRALTRMESSQIRLESNADIEKWSSYSVLLDDNITLEKVSVWAVKPDGERLIVDPKDHGSIPALGSSELHSSTRYHVAEFPPLPEGSMVHVGHEVRVQTYFPSGGILIRGRDRIGVLRVEVRGARSGFRWRIDGPTDGLNVEQTEDGLVITGENLPPIDPPDLAPGGSAFPMLRYAWGERATWSDVGEWYSDLVADLPRKPGPVRQQARELIAESEDPWERLNALLSYAQRRVRYVAVEVGIGGWKPSTPEETLKRKWGDCKDKSFLLLDLLDEAGIEAYPALIHGSTSRRIDPQFPTPFAFNHAIVALPVKDWFQGDDLPLAGGYLFVDPTQTAGAASFLYSSTQAQHALVVRGDESELIQTPLLEQLEGRSVNVELDVLPGGDARGEVRFEIRGSTALYYLQQLASSPSERVEQDVRDLLDDLVPGSTLSSPSWGRGGEDLPTMTMQAKVRVSGLVQGQADRRSFQVAGFRRTPGPRVLGERTLPVTLRPVSSHSIWRVRVPDGWCLPENKVLEVDNPVGSFRQAVSSQDGTIVIDRSVELRRKFVEPDEFAALRELSLAEHRAHKRRIRLRCPD